MTADQFEGLVLSITKEAGGWAFEWRTAKGRYFGGGWTAGTRREGKEEAQRYMRELIAKAKGAP